MNVVNILMEIGQELAAAIQPVEHFLDIFKGAEREEALRIFKELRLPVPEERNFIRSHNGGIFFHTDSGVVIRAEDKDTSKLDALIHKRVLERFHLDVLQFKAYGINPVPHRFVNDHILQPVTSFATSEHIIEIVPGARLGVADADIAKMRRNLARDGIHFLDMDDQSRNPFMKIVNRNKPEMLRALHHTSNQGKNNSAYLPVKTDEFPNGFPVIIDRFAAGSIPLLRDPESFVAKLMGRGVPETSTAPIQKKLYKPLIDALADAWPDTTKPADSTKMENFWTMCGELKHRSSETGEPLLTTGWTELMERNTNFGKHNAASKSAAGYQNQVRNR